MIIKGLYLKELKQYLKSLNQPEYRAAQIFQWLYQKQANDWDEMTDLPQDLRLSLKEQKVSLGCLKLRSHSQATDGTIKYLFELSDKRSIESVYIPEAGRRTVCFSTQVGCGLGCVFCATGQQGLIRNLNVAEIIDQPLRISRATGERISNLVAMGQGEPLANYDALLKAIRIFNDPKGMGIGARHITVSTCGLVPGIDRFAEEDHQVNLAVSLHAASDELRDRLMPINKSYPLQELMAACQKYITKTGRRVTFEYVMIAEVNDRQGDLNGLVRLLSGMLCHVNLIPFNPIPDSEFKRSRPQRVQDFATRLTQAGIETTIRRERGSDFDAACGQLQGKWQDE